MPSTKNPQPEYTKQAVRMRRYYIAAFTSLLVLFLIFACSWLGFVDSKILVIAGLLILFFIALFYLIFRTQLNLKFSDPSLTEILLSRNPSQLQAKIRNNTSSEVNAAM